MRARTTAALAALLLAALTGCGADATPDKPAATAAVSPDEKFLSAVHDRSWESWAEKKPTDEELATFPPMWCTELKRGHSVAYILDANQGNLYPIGMTWGTKKKDAQELVVLGVESYCPEFRDQVTEELRSSGTY